MKGNNKQPKRGPDDLLKTWNIKSFIANDAVEEW